MRDRGKLASRSAAIAIAALLACAGRDGDATSLGASQTSQTNLGDACGRGETALCAPVNSGPYFGPYFYVAPAPYGSDAASGRPSRPFATLQKAVDSLRALGLPGNVDAGAFQAAGVYKLAANVSWGAADSGSSAHPVTYVCTGAPGTCSNQSSTQATGCAVWSGAIYRCPVGVSTVNTIYENGVRLRLARTPNYVADPNFLDAQTPYFLAASNTSTTVLDYGANALGVGSWTLPGASLVIWMGPSANNWFTESITIASVNAGAHTLTLTQPTSYSMIGTGPLGGMRFFVQGDLSMLDATGEWCCRDTSGGYVYLIPNATPISGEDIEIPNSVGAFRLVGANDSTSRVKYVVLNGFEIKYTDAVSPSSTNDYNFGYLHLPAAVRLENTDHVTLTNMHLTAIGNTGITAHWANSNDTISNVLVEHTGRHGILFDNMQNGLTSFGVSPSGDVNTANTVDSFKIRHFGETYGFGQGLWNWNASNSTFTHGEISYGPLHGVYAMATGSSVANHQDVYMAGNTFNYIYLHHVVQETGDGGALHEFGLKNGELGQYSINTHDQILIDSIDSVPGQVNVKPIGVYEDTSTYFAIFTNIKHTNIVNAQPCIWSSTPNYTKTNVLCTNPLQGNGLVDGSATFDNSLMQLAAGQIGVRLSYPY